MRVRSGINRLVTKYLAQPLPVLALGLVITLVVSLFFLENARTDFQIRFDRRVELNSVTIESSLRHYTSLLEAGASIFAFRSNFTDTEFQNYIEGFYRPRDHPGIQGIGFARYIPDTQREQVERQITEENPAFRILPTGDRPEYVPIIYLYPQDRRNQVAIGYDMFSEPVRRAAMIKARDTGMAAASGKVELVQEIDERKQAGFLIYAPAYRDGVVPQDPEMRRRNLVGFVYSPFRADDLLEDIFSLREQPKIHFTVFDGEPVPENRLHRSRLDPAPSPRLTETRTLDIANRNWTVEFASTRLFEQTSREKWVPLIAGPGVLLSLLFSWVVASLSKARSVAELSQKEESEQRERLGVILASIGDGVIAIDPHGKISFVNAVAERFTGWPFVEARGRPLEDVFRILNWETREQVPDSTPRVSATQQGLDLPGHTLLVSRDGAETPITNSVSPIRKGGRSVGGLVIVFHDLTEEQKSRRALQESEARSSGILKSALDAIVTSNEKGEIIEWNPSAERIFGYSRNEVMNHQMETLIIPPSSRQQHRLGMQHYLTTGETRVIGRRIEITAMRKGGEEFSAELAISRLDLPGPALFTAHIRDITERRQTEAALHEAQAQLTLRATNLEELVSERTVKLQEVIAELEAFSYSISHDMRAPLRAIEGFAHALMDDYEEKLEPEGVGYLKRIMSAAVRMDRLIQDVLSYSRVVRTDIESVPVDTEQLLGDIISQSPEFRAPKAEVVIHRPLLKVMGQEASLTQCLSNLLGNAVKFVAPDLTPHIEIWTEEANNHVRLYIKDNGVGIEPRHRDRVFRIFERVHPETQFSGTGIGLAIVKKSVERMGGTLEFESESGKGTTFCLHLPRAS